MRLIYSPSAKYQFAAPAWAGQCRLGHVQLKAVLLLLANYADEEFSCFPSQQRIADETEQSVNTVQRQLKWLEHFGAIRRERRTNHGGHRTSDRFILNVNWLLDAYHNPDGTECEPPPLTLNAALAEYPEPFVPGAPAAPSGDLSPTPAEQGSGGTKDVTKALPTNLVGRDSDASPTHHQVVGRDEPNHHLMVGREAPNPHQVVGRPNHQNPPPNHQKAGSYPPPSGGVTPRTPTTRTPSSSSGRAGDSPAGDPAAAGAAGKKKRLTPMPEDFAMDDGMRAWAAERCPLVDAEFEVEQCRDYWIGKGEHRADWGRTWMTWMRKAQRDAEQQAGWGAGPGRGGQQRRSYDDAATWGAPPAAPDAEPEAVPEIDPAVFFGWDPDEDQAS